ncbi:hypothetical protein [Dankookia sp. P2]|uniref:hypothetical protein n=1 Tax=Dankookia sp. P2 TaxID=3423955 RepID=UPI003D667C4E
MPSIGPEAQADVVTLLFDAEAGARNGGPVQAAPILCAACLLTLTDEEQQARYWECFRHLSCAYLMQSHDATDGSAAVAEFLGKASYSDIAHFRRNDPHLWNVRLHIVMIDGQWLVCDGRYDGILFILGNKNGDLKTTGGHVGEGSTKSKTVAEIIADIEAGFHARASGRTPVVRMLLSNARPLDQSATISQIGQALEVIQPHQNLRLYQHKTTAFFDPAIFPAIKRRQSVIFYMGREADPRAEALRLGESVAEAFYLPDPSRAAAHKTSLFLKEYIAPVVGPKLHDRDPATVKIFVSLEFEKRVWIEQVDAFLQLFKKLQNANLRLCVAVNGMTGTIFESLTREMMDYYEPIVEREKR